MAKVVFEFDENNESSDIEEVVHRHLMSSTIFEIQQYVRELYHHSGKANISIDELKKEIDRITEKYDTIFNN